MQIYSVALVPVTTVAMMGGYHITASAVIMYALIQLVLLVGSSIYCIEIEGEKYVVTASITREQLTNIANVNGGVVAMRSLTNILCQHFMMIPVRIGRREMTRNEAIKFAKENILAYTSEMAEFKALAIEAIEKQIPKKPIFSHNLSDTLSVFHCECGNTIKVSHDAGIMNNNNAANYCSKCGCRLDWSDAE